MKIRSVSERPDGKREVTHTQKVTGRELGEFVVPEVKEVIFNKCF